MEGMPAESVCAQADLPDEGNSAVDKSEGAPDMLHVEVVSAVSGEDVAKLSLAPSASVEDLADLVLKAVDPKLPLGAVVRVASVPDSDLRCYPCMRGRCQYAVRLDAKDRVCGQCKNKVQGLWTPPPYVTLFLNGSKLPTAGTLAEAALQDGARLETVVSFPDAVHGCWAS
eukprot:gb/GFBE01078406.1/.p1 GENE.gb/GFBE01078406.1/~~gb/GFBE01078406.1/.p1  ORF type:complete len:171 (+),score=36.97 gb/GFBE01078406.1/:1-513(+)